MSQEKVKALPAIGFVEATKRGFKNLFNIKERARRSEFWWYMIMIIVLWAICASTILLSGFWSTPMGKIGNGEFVLHVIVMFVLGIAPLLFTITSHIRRFHDIGKTGTVPMLTGIAWLTTAISFQVQLTYELISIRNNEIPIDWGLNVATFAFCVFVILALTSLYYLLKDSEIDSNRYGKSPKYVKD